MRHYSASMSNAAQQGAEAVAINSNTSSNTISTTVTAASEESWVVDVVGCGNAGSFTIHENKTIYHSPRS